MHKFYMGGFFNSYIIDSGKNRKEAFKTKTF
jgi:hypothetical protein